MSSKILTGLEVLLNDKDLQKTFPGQIGLLCHSASVDHNYRHAAEHFIDLFGDRFTTIFGPQHGFVTDVQDNMIESDHYIHPYFKRKIYSLYSETRIPTDEMLSKIDHLFVDLQDIGTRIYTYIYTLTHLLEACANHDVEVIVLDRPNPINAKDIEGNILDPAFATFVGRHPIPVRHGLTMGEVAKMHQSFWYQKPCRLRIITMQKYLRQMSYEDTGLPFVNPSPNIPNTDSCFCFVGTVLLEGTSLSEGRGTTRPLEVIGHPKFDPWKYHKHFSDLFRKLNLKGFSLRPIHFLPMFQKHQQQNCGGYFIHSTDRNLFKPWRVGQVLLKEFKRILPADFHYKSDPYEYEYQLNPMDMINGTDRIRSWYDQPLDYEFLEHIEQENMSEYLAKRKEILLY